MKTGEDEDTFEGLHGSLGNRSICTGEWESAMVVRVGRDAPY